VWLLSQREHHGEVWIADHFACALKRVFPWLRFEHGTHIWRKVVLLALSLTLKDQKYAALLAGRLYPTVELLRLDYHAFGIDVSDTN